MNDFVAKIQHAASGKTHLFYTGQAGYILKSCSGQLLGLDLYLSECVERVEGHMGFKRLLPRLLSPFALEFDAVVATHAHYDHFDPDAVPGLMSNRKTRLFASTGCAEEAKRLYLKEEQISYVKPGDVCRPGDFTLEFVPCDHGSAARDAVGVVITVDSIRIYMAGDTCFRPDRVEALAEKGPFDVMIAPINGAFGNMNEEECARLSRALSPALTIPSHYGMFASHGGSPGLFMEEMGKICPENTYLLMTQGEGITL